MVLSWFKMSGKHPEQQSISADHFFGIKLKYIHQIYIISNIYTQSWLYYDNDFYWPLTRLKCENKNTNATISNSNSTSY